jgi:hypothetical protein
LTAGEGSQVTIFEGGLPQISFVPNGVTKITSNEVATTLVVDPSKVRTTEVSILPTTVVTPNGISKISISHNDSAQVNSDTRAFQVNAAEVNPSHQIVTPIIEANVSKVAFSSSISSQQFFNSNLLSFNLHDLLPNFKNVYLVATTQWINSLDSTEPFDISLQVTDLPAGQLAEASITDFNPIGRLISGTLTHLFHRRFANDIDGNGLVWFVDSTPQDHAEFATATPDTFFRATLGSAAYGHYDLLTTILHVRAAFALANTRPPRRPNQRQPHLRQPRPNQPFGKQ